MVGDVVGEVWLGYKAGFWRSDLVKDTIVWFIVSASPSNASRQATSGPSQRGSRRINSRPPARISAPPIVVATRGRPSRPCGHRAGRPPPSPAASPAVRRPPRKGTARACRPAGSRKVEVEDPAPPRPGDQQPAQSGAGDRPQRPQGGDDALRPAALGGVRGRGGDRQDQRGDQRAEPALERACGQQQLEGWRGASQGAGPGEPNDGDHERRPPVDAVDPPARREQQGDQRQVVSGPLRIVGGGRQAGSRMPSDGRRDPSRVSWRGGRRSSVAFRTGQGGARTARPRRRRR
jgi:hypothetical protein